MLFLVPLTIYFRMQELFSYKALIILRWHTKYANFRVMGAVTPEAHYSRSILWPLPYTFSSKR